MLFVVIIGGIYLGVFTPTEAAGIGAAGRLPFRVAARQSRLATARIDALVESGITTGMIFVVTFGALVFSNFINIAGMTAAMTAWIESLHASPLGVVLAMCLIYIILGCVFDSLAMLILTVPVFAAILNPMGVDLIWFGIVVIIVVELGLITPPIGMNVFVVNVDPFPRCRRLDHLPRRLAASSSRCCLASALIIAFPSIATVPAAAI